MVGEVSKAEKSFSQTHQLVVRLQPIVRAEIVSGNFGVLSSSFSRLVRLRVKLKNAM
jgi:hypothetical protein